MNLTIEKLKIEVGKLVKETQSMSVFSNGGVQHVVRPIERAVIKNPITKEVEIREANYRSTGLASVGTFRKNETFYDFKKRWIATKTINLLERHELISFEDFVMKENE